MGTTNRGNQRIVFDYKYPLKGTDFNFLMRDMLPPGIYKGGEMSCDLGLQTITINPFVAVLYSDTQRAVRVETTIAFSLEADYNNPVIYASYLYDESEENYADIGFTTSESSVANETVLGRALFSGTTLIGISYQGRDMGLLYSGTMYLPDGGIQTSGNLHTSQDLIVDGNATVSGNADISGSETVGGNLDVTGQVTSNSIILKSMKGAISGGGVYYTPNSTVCGAEPGVYEVYDGTIVELTARVPATLGSHAVNTWAYVALSKTGVVALIEAPIYTYHFNASGATISGANTYKYTPSPYDEVLGNYDGGVALFSLSRNGYYPTTGSYSQYRIIGAVWKNSSGNYLYGVSYKSGRNKNDNVLEGIGATSGTQPYYSNTATHIVDLGIGGGRFVYGFREAHFHKMWGNDYKILDTATYGHRIISLRSGLRVNIHYRLAANGGTSTTVTVNIDRVRPDGTVEILNRFSESGVWSFVQGEFPVNVTLSDSEYLAVVNTVNYDWGIWDWSRVIRLSPPKATFEVI